MWGAIVLGIIMFMLLVIIHEIGHFIAAKKSGVKVEEFGIGVPPKVMTLRKDKSGTKYTLNLIPLWGFVRLKGEDPENPETFRAKDSFIKAKLWKKIIILLAGISMNAIAAWLIFTTIFTLGTKPIQIVPDNMVKGNIQSFLTPTKYFLYKQWLITGDIEKDVVIEDIYADWLADHAGIQSGDTILLINDIKVNTRNIEKTLKDHIGTTFDFTYRHGWQIITKSVTCPQDNCILGIMYISSINPANIKEIKFPLMTAMKYGVKEVRAQTKMTFWFLGTFGKSLITLKRTNIQESLNKMTWPAGAVKIWEMILNTGGWKVYLGFAGMISLALAIFNILPIPALDGGRLLGVFIQRIGRLKEEKYFNIEWYINLAFFILLMGLGIYILLQDLVRMWGINIPFIG